MAAAAKPKELKQVLDLAIDNKFLDARNKLMDVMLNYGLSGLDVIKQIQKEIINLELENRKKLELIEKCGEIEFRMTEGSDEFIQLEALVAAIAATAL
jgi:replication factor C small subunit